MSWLRAARGTKINSFDPPLTAVCTAYATRLSPQRERLRRSPLTVT